MNTAEMWTKAQNDGKIYRVVDGDVAYSKKYGLTDKDDFADAWGLEAWKDHGAKGLDTLFSYEWEEIGKEDNVMTIKEAEVKFGIKIVR